MWHRILLQVSSDILLFLFKNRHFTIKKKKLCTKKKFKNTYSKRSSIAIHKPQDLCSKSRQQIFLQTFQYCSLWEVSEWIAFWHCSFTDIGQNMNTFFLSFPCTITYSLTNKHIIMGTFFYSWSALYRESLSVTPPHLSVHRL